jgi:hypothetical protein
VLLPFQMKQLQFWGLIEQSLCVMATELNGEIYDTQMLQRGVVKSKRKIELSNELRQV